MGPEEIDRTNRIELTRVQSGLFLAIGNLLAPTTLPLAWIILNSDALKDSLPSTKLVIMVGIVAALTIFWAASIVRCVTDIVREYSATSRFGLFLLLISPMLWFGLSVAYVYFAVATSLASLVTQMGLTP